MSDPSAASAGNGTATLVITLGTGQVVRERQWPARYGRAALKRSLWLIDEMKKKGTLLPHEIVYCFLREAGWISELAHAGALDLAEAGKELRAAYAEILPDELSDLDRRMNWAREHGQANPRTLADRHRELPRVPESLLAPPESKNGAPPPAPAPFPPCLPLCRVFDMARLDPSKDLIRGLLGPRELALLWGDPSSGKSLVAVDLACSLVTGVPFFSHKVQHRGPVIYLAAEGAGGIRSRVEAWCTGSDPALRGSLERWFYVIPAAPNLLHAGQAAELLRTVEGLAASLAEPLVLVVIDTLAAVTPGVNENEQQGSTALVSICRQIAQKTGAPVLVIHHARKSGDEYRGSSVLGAGFDVILRTTRASGGRLELHPRKQKDRELAADGWSFKAEPVVIQTGDSETEEIRSVRVGSVQRIDEIADESATELETTLCRVIDALVAAGHPSAETKRRDLKTGIVLLLADEPLGFGRIAKACTGLAGETKDAASKIGKTLRRMAKAGELTETGKSRKTYALEDKGRTHYSGVLDALKNLPEEEAPW